MHASIASPIGTALIPTHGSCRPLTEIFVFLPFLSTVFLLLIIEEVGLTAKEATISCPEEIPPRIPPALLAFKFYFPDPDLISSEFSSPDKYAEFIPDPIFTPLTAFILIKPEAISASSFE